MSRLLGRQCLEYLSHCLPTQVLGPHCLPPYFTSSTQNEGCGQSFDAPIPHGFGLATTLKYLHTNESYEHLEMDKILETEKTNEKISASDEYRKVS